MLYEIKWKGNILLNLRIQNYISAANVYNTKPIGVSKQQGLSRDTVSFTGLKHKGWAEDVTPEARKQIINDIKKIDFDNDKPLGLGADGMVFKLEGNSQFPEGVVIKVSHTQNRHPITGEMQRVGETFEKEQAILKEAGKINENSQSYIGSLVTADGRNVMISTLVPGKHPSFNTNPLDNKTTESLLEALNTLDSKNILHRDLKKENIFTKDGTAGLLDYGVSIKFSPLDFDTNIDSNHFTPFEIPTNLKNFEHTFLGSYMDEMAKQSPEKAADFFKNYLSIRAEKVHEPTSLRLKNYIKTNEENLTPDQLEKLENMAHYQEICAKVLSKPSKAVANVELLKQQIGYNSELAYKNEVLLLNPLANMTLKFNSLIAAKKLEQTIDELLKKPCEADTKEYLRYQNEFAQYQLNKVSGWTEGLTNWLLSCLKTPIGDANSSQKAVIDLFTEKPLNEFEIPNIRTIQ